MQLSISNLDNNKCEEEDNDINCKCNININIGEGSIESSIFTIVISTVGAGCLSLLSIVYMYHIINIK